MFTLIIRDRSGAERPEQFEDNEVMIGRVPGNNLVLRAGNVSRQHARIAANGSRLIVSDMGSSNGTYVNGRKIRQPTILRDGDEIWIGDFYLRVELTPPASSIAIPMPRQSKWYVFHAQGGTQGPMTTAQVTGGIRSGVISPDSQVCVAGGGKWQAIGSVEEFATSVRAVAEMSIQNRPLMAPTEVPEAPQANNESKVYWYVINGEAAPFGPFTTDQVRQAVRNQQIPVTVQVNRAGSPDWFELVAVPEFAEELLTMGR